MEHPIAFIQSSGAHCYDPVRGTVKFSVFHKGMFYSEQQQKKKGRCIASCRSEGRKK